jgi:hypothetical protein
MDFPLNKNLKNLQLIACLQRFRSQIDQSKKGERDGRPKVDFGMECARLAQHNQLQTLLAAIEYFA